MSQNDDDTGATNDTHGPANDTFAKWFQEILSMVQELEARRRFDADVADWLKETDRTKDFEAYRSARGVSARDPNRE